MNPRMRDDLVKAIGQDGKKLVQLLEERQVAEQVEYISPNVFIPGNLIEDQQAFQEKLSKLSSHHRAFPLSFMDGRLCINTSSFNNPSHEPSNERA